MFCHQPIFAFAARKLISKYKGVCIYSFHSPLSSEYALRHPAGMIKSWWNRKILNYIERRAISQCELVFFDSNYMNKLFQQIHPQLVPQAQQLLPLGVNLEFFNCKNDRSEARKQLKLWPEKPLAFTLRNLEPRMGLGSLIAE